MIAADANKSNSITTLDLVELRRLILHIDEDLSNNTSWRFINKQYVFPNFDNPWEENFPELINLNNLNDPQENLNFVAVKIGDVNGSAELNSFSHVNNRNLQSKKIFVQEKSFRKDETVQVDFILESIHQLLGLQGTIEFDVNQLEFVSLIENSFVKSSNFGTNNIEKGFLTYSINEKTKDKLLNEVIFSIVFKAHTDGKLSNNLTFSSALTLNELYDWNGEIYSQELIFTELHEYIELDLFNYPNPFSNHTIIQFNLPVETAYQLIFRDVSGKEVKAISAVGNKGLNEVIFNANEVPNSGIILYELKTKETSIIKKMVLIN